MGKNRFTILWGIWTIIGVALFYGVASMDDKSSVVSIIANVISLAPLIGILLALGSEKASSQFYNWLRENNNSRGWIVGGISVLFAIPGLLTGKFNPYYTVIFCCIVSAVLGTLQKEKKDEFIFLWTDLLLWLVLWIPFDLRWYMDMLPAVSETYTWWSIAISVVAVIGWNGYRNVEIGYRLVPKIKDLYIPLIALFGIMVLVVPPGLITGFLTFSVPKTFDIPKLAAHFIGLFLTVALPEELFFRGLLLRGLEKVSSKKWVPMVVSSLAFGLMHWNNVSTLPTQITYVALATIAGLGYAWAYKKSGNNLLAAILTHTLVDWVWKLVLAG